MFVAIKTLQTLTKAQYLQNKFEDPEILWNWVATGSFKN